MTFKISYMYSMLYDLKGIKAFLLEIYTPLPHGSYSYKQSTQGHTALMSLFFTRYPLIDMGVLFG